MIEKGEKGKGKELGIRERELLFNGHSAGKLTKDVEEHKHV